MKTISSLVVSDPRDIERVDMAVVDATLERMKSDVLLEAEQVLGYKNQDFMYKGILMTTLKELGIKILDPVQVKLYKASKEQSYKVMTNSVSWILYWCIQLAILSYLINWSMAATTVPSGTK